MWGNASDGVITGVSNMLGGIAYILTPPARPAGDWEKHQSFARGGRRADLTRLSVHVGALPDGARVGIRYEW